MTEHDAADQKHLRQIAQAEFVAQPPEHHERDDVGGVLRPVQQALTALIELFAAVATAYWLRVFDGSAGTAMMVQK